MVHKSPPQRIRPKIKRSAPRPEETKPDRTNPDQPRRGRPRAYDPEAALARATATFWDAGYAATSLDDLSAATGMNRPSLYAAFGNKHALYALALACYRIMLQETLQAALESEAALRPALINAYRAALEIFCAGPAAPRGCFIIGTALTEAVQDPKIRQALLNDLSTWDEIFAARFRFARTRGELGAKPDPETLAGIAAAILHSLAIRARAGEAPKMLEAIVESAADLICAAGRETKPGILFGGTY